MTGQRRGRALLAAGAATAAAQHQIDFDAAATPPRRMTAPQRAALARLADEARPWRRRNYRGTEVDVRGGLALATGLLVAAARTGTGAEAAGGVAAIGAACAAGLADDMAEDSSARGLRGHLRELRRGRVTTGMAKLLAITAGAAAFAWPRQLGQRPAGGRRRTIARLWQAGVDTALVAGAANLANLLDLRPGRALKAAGVPAAMLAARGGDGSDLAAGVVGAALAAAPDDLGERTMLGDSGANALGAAVGIAAVRGLRPTRRALAAAAVAALILASEKVSFTRVIAVVPPLRWLDNLGRMG
ncbi:MAG: hypothetical protein LBL01_00415 [Bifidobacteriaceae bacterium]|nr:hypothetical protein [Bifidobacteriaceae bacterium]